MKKIVIGGKFYKIDFDQEIRIHEKHKPKVKEIIHDLIEEQILNYKDRYALGFLDIAEPESLKEIPRILKKIRDLIMSAYDYKISIRDNIDKIVRKIKNKLGLREDIQFYVLELCNVLETRLYYVHMMDKGPVLVTLANFYPQQLFDLPSNVVGLIYPIRPSEVELDILASKSLFCKVSKEVLKEDLYYTFDKYENGFLPGLMLLEKPLERSKRLKFQLGLNIFNEVQIKNGACVDPDFIIVEPEKSYIETKGIVHLEDREIFYKKIFETYPNSDILVSLPKLRLQDIYFNLDNYLPFTLNRMVDHALLYEIELKSLFKYANDRVVLSIPDIERVEDFNSLRKEFTRICREVYKKDIKIGLDINTQYCSDELQSFKKFNHGMIYLDKGYELFKPIDILKMQYLSEFSHMNNILYRKLKKVYLMGKDLENYHFFERLITRGFRRFTIKPELFDLFSSKIFRYNQDRGLYDEITQ